MLMNPCRIAALAPLAVAFGVSGALAQAPARVGPAAAVAPAPQAAPPTAATPAAPRPDRTTATYGDWVLRCELPAGGGERACEAAQTVLDQRGQVLAQIAARQPSPAGGITLVVQVGTNATVSEPLRLSVEGQAVLTLSFRRCLPRGCFAETQPGEDELGALLRRTEPAQIEFVDSDGQAVAIPASLRGLSASLDALWAADRR